MNYKQNFFSFGNNLQWATLGVIFFFFFILFSLATWMTPIYFDDAFNFQVAQSLSDSFQYKTKYLPAKVYHPRITTNGPIQYFMAVMIKFFGIDLGRSLALGMVAALAALSIFVYSKLAFFLYCIFLLFWPRFVWMHTLFLGEIPAITGIILGLLAWEVWIDRSAGKFVEKGFVFSAAHFSNSFWLSGLFFGYAISTKLFAAPAILVLLFCLGIYKSSVKIERHGPPPSIKWKLAFFWCIAPFILAFVFFLIQFSFSILHTDGSLSEIPLKLNLFFDAHFKQFERSILNTKTTWVQESLPLLFVLAGILFFLIRKHFVFIILTVICGGLIFEANLYIRRLLPLLLPVVFIGLKECFEPLWGKILQKTKRNERWMNKMIFSVLFILIICSVIFSQTPRSLGGILRSFSIKGADHNTALILGGDEKYDQNLISLIKEINGPIFTSGWWQFPEISLRSGVQFYDRFSPANRYLLDEKFGAYLLFSSGNPKDKNIEQSLCGNKLYIKGPLILCRYNQK